MKKFYNNWLDKIPVVKYILNSFVKWFIGLVLICSVLYAFLSITGLYLELESALDLKYNSPFVLIPLFASIALAVLCFLIGFLLYFHKYKRTKSKTKFYQTVSVVFDTNKRGGKR